MSAEGWVRTDDLDALRRAVAAQAKAAPYGSARRDALRRAVTALVHAQTGHRPRQAVPSLDDVDFGQFQAPGGGR